MYHKYGAKLKPKELNFIKKAFPGELCGATQGEKINIARIFDQEYNNILDKVYKKVDISNTFGSDEPTDNLGFLGKSEWYREKKLAKDTPITEQEFI